MPTAKILEHIITKAQIKVETEEVKAKTPVK